MRLKPFAYQYECLAAIAHARKDRAQRALIVMASGLGKTVTVAFDAKRWIRERGGRVLYLCHQNDILEQARQTFEVVLGPQCTYGYFHGQERSHRGATCVFASFQTMREARNAFGRNAFSYIVVDESHHGHARTYLPTLKYFKPDFLLGITATPDRRDLRDIRTIYGQEVFSLSLEVALARGLLARVDYRLLTDDLQNLDALNTPIGRLSVKYLNKKLFVPRRDEEIARIIRRYMRKIDVPRVMIFCPSVKYCDALSVHLPGSMALHSGLSQNEQQARLRRFRSGLVNAILTVDKFNEGVDIPEANLIVFLRSTSSRTVFFQQLGRGLRRATGKEKVIVLDFVANCERLQTINDLWEGVSQRSAEDRLREYIPVMNVEAGNVHFTHVAKRVLDVLAAIRGGYTREMLIHQLRVLGKELKRAPRQVDVSRASTQGKCASSAVFGRVFGSFSEALIVAGFPIDPSTRRYTKSGILRSLRTLARELGHPPTGADVNRACARGACPSVNTISNTFGSFTIALREARLTVKRRYGESRESLLEQLRALAAKLGRTPTAEDVNAASKKSKGASIQLFVKKFGSFYAAREAAGLLQVRVRHDTSRQGLIAQLRSLAKELKRTPTVDDIRDANKKGKCSGAGVFAKAFGSVTKAQATAGLSLQRFVTTQRATKKEMVRQLQRLSKKLKRTPFRKDVNEASERGECASSSTLSHRFGSFSKALRAAGMLPKVRRDYTKAEVVRVLKALAKRLHRTPSKSDVAEAWAKGQCTIATSACMKLFGSYTRALQAAGLEVARSSRRYSKTEILQQLRQLAKELKGTPVHRDVAEACRKGRCASPSSIAKKFGTFNTALRVAGLKVTRQQLPAASYTRAGLLAHLKKLARELGRAPTTREIIAARKEGKSPGWHAYKAVFGSYTKARKAAGLEK